MKRLLLILSAVVIVNRKRVCGRASVKVTPDSTQFFEYDKVTVSCEEFGPGDWTVWRFAKSGAPSQCGSTWGFNSSSSACELKTITTHFTGLYWCESKYGGSSDTINITVTGFSVILESPVLVTVGQDVVLSCRSKHKSPDLKVDFYKDKNLLKSGPEPQTTIRFSGDQQGAYTCSINGQSSPPVHMYLQEDSPAPVLVLNPDSEQFLEYTSVNLFCEPQTEGWAVHRYRPSSKTGSQCGSGWGLNRTGSVCELNRMTTDSGIYWCGKNTRRSNSVQILVKVGGVVVQVPARPVSLGQSVTLSCQHYKDHSLPASFYRDGHFLSEQPARHMTLQQVALSDEGLYKCKIGAEWSEASRLRVKPAEPPPETLRSALSLLHLRYIIVFAPYVASTLLCISIYRQTGGGSVVPRRTRRRQFNIDPEYEDVIPDVTTEYQF